MQEHNVQETQERQEPEEVQVLAGGVGALVRRAAEAAADRSASKAASSSSRPANRP